MTGTPPRSLGDPLLYRGSRAESRAATAFYCEDASLLKYVGDKIQTGMSD